MKTCPNCQAQLDDNAMFCANCGTPYGSANQTQQNTNFNGNYTGYQQPYAAPVDPYDHTSEFDAKDISDNKVISMLVYLLGWIGIIVALLGSSTSPYAAFHVRQALKFEVVNALMIIITALLSWTIIVPILYGIMCVVFFVIKIICFFQICNGKAKEPALIRSLGFLR